VAIIPDRPLPGLSGGGGGGFGLDGSVTMLFPSHPSRGRQAVDDPVPMQPAPR
jgi:hypothetical protein